MNIEISSKEYNKKLNWRDAMLYCQLLVIDGKDDWRLPSTDELFSIFYHDDHDFRGGYYWTSDEYEEYKEYTAQAVNNIDNRKYINMKQVLYYVRPVRTIEPS
jgi:hypothetical protein